MEKSLDAFLSAVDKYVWGIPLIVLILLVGAIFTIRLKGIQLRHLPEAFHFMRWKGEGKGEISSFSALCTALSATVGTGNIVGVATAITAGGPGALFWMVLAACLGMATKYAEATLAVKYRSVDKENHVLGGPFYYIERGMKEKFGHNFKWLAVLFAVFGMLVGLLGIGTVTQINSITSGIQNFFDPKKASTVSIFGGSYSWATVLAAVAITLLTALVIIGGLKRISAVATKIVPTMFVIYFVSALYVIAFNAPKLGGAFGAIFSGAFNGTAAVGGFAGAVVAEAIRSGIARGIFSNESGLGSSPIAAAAGKVLHPAQQGLVSMLGTFFDTIIICNVTGLCIISSGAYQVKGLQGFFVTDYAFRKAFFFAPQVGSFLLMICLTLFAFTTILGWNYYGTRCVSYLTGSKNAVTVYNWLYIVALAAGPFLALNSVWTLADIVNGLMAFPNLIALFALSGVVKKETDSFFDYLRRNPYKKSKKKKKDEVQTC
ncbi:MAG: sodium:alanine symporter family protein [Oscillospiraceae bacterium]|nr:sodium:alanine symporter family protein [Oscillospiraceae bacterium]